MEPKDAAALLNRLNWSDQAIAEACASSQPVINRIRHGQRKATFDVGNALIALAKKEQRKAQRKAS